MAKYVVNDTDLTSVADAIRTKGGTSDALVFPAGFVTAVEAITGGGLNFSVVGGETQPENPEENTIWIDTGTAITGWEFSATQPSVTTEGFVWVKTYNTGYTPFNMSPDNAVYIYPSRASQVIDGAWEDVEMSFYANGAWDTGNKILFDGAWHGDWYTYTFPKNNGTSYDKGYLIIKMLASTQTFSVTLDLTDYDVLEVEYNWSDKISTTVEIVRDGTRVALSEDKDVNTRRCTALPVTHVTGVCTFNMTAWSSGEKQLSFYALRVLKVVGEG